MGIGDSIGKAAENAMEDLAQTSDPTDDAHVPEPGASDEDIQVHSSISEGSNAGDNDIGPQQSRTTYTPQGPGTEASGGQGASGTEESAAADESTGAATSGGIGAAGATDAPEAARGVPGPAGLPEPDPEDT